MSSEIGRTHVVDVEAGAAVPPEGHFLYARDTDKLYKSDGTTLTELATGGAGLDIEGAQDAVGAMVDTTLVYTDGTPLLSRAALTGDVTASAGSNATTIANDSVTFAKMQNINQNRILGRFNAGSGDVEEVFVGGGGSMLLNAGTLVRAALTGDVTASQDGNTTTIANDSVTYAKMQNVSAASKLVGRGDSGGGDPQEITLGTNLSISGTTLNASGGKRVVGVTFDGNGSTPTVGSVGYVVCPFSGTIDQWHVVANASGSAVIEVWKAAGSIPTGANAISGTEKPTLSAQQLASDTSLTTWTTTAVTAGDVFGFELESVTTCTRVTVEVRVIEA